MDIKILLKPNVSEELAIDLVHRLYGLNVTSIKKLISFDDQNFYIKISEDHSNPHLSGVSEHGYTLKITNTLKSAQEGHFDAMHFAMIHLTNKGLSVPAPIKNLEGKTWSMEEVPLLNADESTRGQKLCGVHLLTFIPGAVISSIEYTRDVLYQWGLLLAKYHNAIEDMDYPELKKKTIVWDLDHIPELENFLDGFDEQKTTLIRSVLNKYPTEITANIKTLPKGFIHGDFNENNVLVQLKSTEALEKTYVVDGILDLEDMHYGTFVWDIGVMLAYTLLDCTTLDPLEGAGHALAGYLSLRSLTDLEMSLLKICIESRLCQSLVLCAVSYREDPSNEYLLTSARTGWSRLEEICSVTVEDLLHKWKRIQKDFQPSNV